MFEQPRDAAGWGPWLSSGAWRAGRRPQQGDLVFYIQSKYYTIFIQYSFCSRHHVKPYEQDIVEYSNICMQRSLGIQSMRTIPSNMKRRGSNKYQITYNINTIYIINIIKWHNINNIQPNSNTWIWTWIIGARRLPPRLLVGPIAHGDQIHSYPHGRGGDDGWGIVLDIQTFNLECLNRGGWNWGGEKGFRLSNGRIRTFESDGIEGGGERGEARRGQTHKHGAFYPIDHEGRGGGQTIALIRQASKRQRGETNEGGRTERNDGVRELEDARMRKRIEIERGGGGEKKAGVK